MRRDLRELDPEQEEAAKGEEAASTPTPTRAAGVLALQRAGGNAAVTAMLMRAGPTAPGNAIEELRALLDDDDETGAIAKMGQLTAPEAATALGDGRLRASAVDCFDNEEMARGVSRLQGGTLEQKLRWMFDEGTDWSLVRPLLADANVPADQKTALYAHNDLRAEFTGICDDDEMATAVSLMGGTLEQRLNWMFAEGTSFRAVQRLISDPAVPADQKSFLLTKDYMRGNFVDLCTDTEMYVAVGHLGGTLDQRLRWMFAEGSNWRYVRQQLADAPPDQRLALYPHNDLRSGFTDVCDDDEMAEAVRLMGGLLSQKLNWMFSEGTNWRAVRGVITDAAVPADQKLALYPLEYMKQFFVENCDNDEMAEATILLGGAYRTERKPWLEAEGTSVNEYLNALTRLAVRETGSVAHRTPAQADQMIKDTLGTLTGAAAGKASRRIEGQVAVVDDDEWDVAGLNDYGDRWPTTRDTINGWVDHEERVWIHKDRGNPATMVHEGCHKWAADTIRGALSWDLNEGITEYFTRKVAAAQTPNLAPGRANYQAQWTVVVQLAAFAGERPIASAYFDGSNDALKAAYKVARGGTNADADWEAFLAAMKAKNWANATALLAAAPAATADAGTGDGGTDDGGTPAEQSGPGGGPPGATETPACN